MPRPGSLERWSPTAFLVAGGLLVVYASLNGFAAFGNTAYPTVEDVVGPAGFGVGFVGLLGMYRGLVDLAPLLTRVGAGAAALGAVGFGVISATSAGKLAGAVPDADPAWFPVPLAMAVLGMIFGFLAFAVASLRHGVPSRSVGLLLFAPPAIFATMLTQAALFAGLDLFSPTTMAWSAFAISGGQAVAHLGIGYALRDRVDAVGPAALQEDGTAS